MKQKEIINNKKKGNKNEDSWIFTKEAGCNHQAVWSVRDWETQQIIQQAYDELVLIPNEATQLEIIYHAEGCDIVHRVFNVIFHDLDVNEPWSEDYVWKRTGTDLTLLATWGTNLYYQWSTGETYQDITVTEPGTYWVRIYNDCGELYDTIQVRDNVEIDLATCDLETNLNMVTWQTTTAQAEYVDHVIIKRDGLEVGTANYSDGFFLDNIGSDLAQRTYTVIAVDTDGSQCPIVSYPKETIHMAYLTGVNNTIEVNWNIPTGYDLLGYNICEWIPNGKDGELNVIDFVGATVTSYTCQVSQFTSGYVIIQGVEAGKTESRLLSNRSSETVGIGEYGMERFKVYPNPTNGIITVETVHAPSLQGQTEYRITNVMGQTLLRGTIEAEKQQIDIQCLLQGVYFISVGSETRKIVME